MDVGSGHYGKEQCMMTVLLLDSCCPEFEEFDLVSGPISGNISCMHGGLHEATTNVLLASAFALT